MDAPSRGPAHTQIQIKAATDAAERGKEMSKKKKMRTPGAERKLFNWANIVEVNLPHSQAAFERGSGETVWAQLSNREKGLYNRDVEAVATVALRNDPYFFPELSYGDELVVRLRPGRKPIAVFDGQLSTQPLNQAAVEAFGLGGEVNLFPAQIAWQFRKMSPEQRLIQLSGADTLGFEGVWIAPHMSAEEVRSFVRHSQSHYSCAHVHAH